MAGLCTGAAAALAVAVLSTATIAMLPYDAGIRDWAAAHIGHWTPVVGQVTPVLHPRLGYVAGNSSFAAGYLIVLIVSPLAGSALGGWAGWAVGRARSAPQARTRQARTRQARTRQARTGRAAAKASIGLRRARNSPHPTRQEPA